MSQLTAIAYATDAELDQPGAKKHAEQDRYDRLPQRV